MSVSFVDCVCSFYVWPVLNCVSVTIEFSVWSIVMIVESNAWDWVYMFVCVCVCESVKISCPWTWIFNHTYGSTLGCIHYHSLFVEVVLSTHFFDFPFPVFNLVVFFPLPSLLHTRACIRILLIYIFFVHCIFIWSPARIMASNKWTVSVPLVAYGTPRSSRWRVAERFPSWSISNRDTDVVYTPLVCPQCPGSWTLSYR